LLYPMIIKCVDTVKHFTIHVRLKRGEDTAFVQQRGVTDNDVLYSALAELFSKQSN
jgi:hypothetical protein